MEELKKTSPEKFKIPELKLPELNCSKSPLNSSSFESPASKSFNSPASMSFNSPRFDPNYDLLFTSHNGRGREEYFNSIHKKYSKSYDAQTSRAYDVDASTYNYPKEQPQTSNAEIGSLWLKQI